MTGADDAPARDDLYAALADAQAGLADDAVRALHLRLIVLLAGRLDDPAAVLDAIALAREAETR